MFFCNPPLPDSELTKLRLQWMRAAPYSFVLWDSVHVELSWWLVTEHYIAVSVLSEQTANEAGGSRSVTGGARQGTLTAANFRPHAVACAAACALVPATGKAPSRRARSPCPARAELTVVSVALTAVLVRFMQA